MEKACIIPKRYPVCNRCVHVIDALKVARRTLDSLPPDTHSVEVQLDCVPAGRTPYAEMAVILEVSPPRNKPIDSDFSRPHALCPGYVTRARETNPKAYPKRDISKLLVQNFFPLKKYWAFKNASRLKSVQLTNYS